MRQLIALPSCRRLACSPSRPMQTVCDICTLALGILLSARPAVHTRAWGPRRGGLRKNLSQRQLVKCIRSASYRHTYLPLSCAGVKIHTYIAPFPHKTYCYVARKHLKSIHCRQRKLVFHNCFFFK